MPFGYIHWALSIIRFLKPLTGDHFTASFADCHFDETIFPSLEILEASIDEKQKKVNVFFWSEKNLSHLDPCTSECENEIHRIINF